MKLTSILTCSTMAAMLTSAQAVLVAHYGLDETSGTTATDSENGYNATYLGATLGGAGKVGTSATFDRTGNASVGFDAALNTADFSVSFWFNNPSFDGISGQDGREAMVGTMRNNWPSVTSGWSIDVDSNGTILTQMGLPGASSGWHTDQVKSGPGAVTAGTWNHIVLSHDSATTTTSLYINGTLADQNTTEAFDPTSAGDPAPFYIGHGGNGGNFQYTGAMDEVNLYNHALSQSEVTALAAVPEPSSAALLGLGGLALILRRRK